MNRLAGMHARQAVSRQNLENAKNSANRAVILYTYDHTRHNVMTTVKSTQKQLPLPGFLAKFESVCLSLHKNLPSLCFQSNLRDFSLTTSLNQPQNSGKPLLMMSTNSQCSLSPLLTFSLTITLT